ncbi:MAG: hypothetical protein AMXMBFR83_22680 [Phycisphaerae bacterium]
MSDRRARPKPVLCALALASIIPLSWMDLSLPRGTTTAIGYCAVVVLAVTACPPRFVIILASISSVLTVAAYFFKPSPQPVWVWSGLVHRALVLAVLWLIVVLGLQRRRAERKWAETAGRLRAIVETAVDAIITIDEHGRIETFNHGAERMFGYRADEVLGRNVSLLMPSPHREDHDAYITHYLATGQKRIIGIGREVLGQRKDGTTFPLDLAVSETRLDGRRIFTGILHEITERKRREEQLRKVIEELERSNVELERFASVISHDLRSPLMTIGGFVHLMVETGGDAGAGDQEAIAYVQQAVRHMDRLLQSLLEYSRVGRSEMKFAPCDTQELLRQTLANLKATIEAGGATVTFDPLPEVMADEVRLGQVFQNLIENALKYRGEEPPRLHVSARANEGEWVFSVRDNGIGIAEPYQQQIFEPFRRLHPDESRYQGIGIGLAISKKIVQQHGGRMWVESNPDRGVTFYFTIRRSDPPA